jgi:hypothetical protein
MDSTTIAYWTCAAAAVAALLYRLRLLRRSPHQAFDWAICVLLFLVAACLFTAAPAVYSLVGRVSGVANLGALLVYAVVHCEGAAAVVLVILWRDPWEQAWPAVRRWFLGYAIILAIMILFFFLGDTPLPHALDFDTYYARTPFIAGFTVVHLLAHAIACATVAVLCWRWAKVAGRPRLRLGLHAITIGATIGGLGFNVCKLTAVTARWLGRDLDVLSTRVGPGLAAGATIIIAAGFVVPAVDRHLIRAHAWVIRARAYHTLHPLWRALRDASPQIVPPIRLPWWDVELRLTRRLTEISDGRLAMRGYFDPRVVQSVCRLGSRAGLPGSDLDALIEAAQLKAAVRAKAHNAQKPAGRAGSTPARGGADGATELAWLVAVSRAFARSPIVAAAAAEVSARADGVRERTGAL